MQLPDTVEKFIDLYRQELKINQLPESELAAAAGPIKWVMIVPLEDKLSSFDIILHTSISVSEREIIGSSIGDQYGLFLANDGKVAHKKLLSAVSEHNYGKIGNKNYLFYKTISTPILNL
jgi:hypothetical protein